MIAERRERLPMTVDEWRALECTSEVKHEYVDGYVYAMAGGTEAHARIAVNAIGALDSALGDGPRMVYSSDVATRLSEDRYTYPDVMVTCGGTGIASRNNTEAGEPRVVFEVLSESTEHYDRTRKFGYYRHCASLQEYVLVNTDSQLVEVYRRTEEGWGLFRMYGPGEVMELTSLGVRIPLATLYRRTDVPEAGLE
jgi:Uma2 family endonuclease